MIVEIRDDFDLEKIYSSGQCFRITKFENGIYRFITEDNILHIKCIEPGVFEIDSPKTWKTVWHNYFDLDRNYAAIAKQILNEHDKLKQMARIGKGVRIVRQEPFEMLITFIISQRKSIPAIKTSIERLCHLCGEIIQVQSTELYIKSQKASECATKAQIDESKSEIYKFPSAKSIAALSYEELALCGLGYRVPYIANAARVVSENENILKQLYNLPDAQLLESLMAFKGVGAKVANCISLFAYNRVNCAPIDVWIARIIEKDFKGENIFEKYESNAGIYQQFMFYYAMQSK